MICIVTLLDPQIERIGHSKLGTWYSTSTWIGSFVHHLPTTIAKNRTWALEGSDGAGETKYVRFLLHWSFLFFSCYTSEH